MKTQIPFITFYWQNKGVKHIFQQKELYEHKNRRTGKTPRHTSHHFRDAYKCRRLHSDKEGNLPKAMDYKQKGCEQQIQCPYVAIEGKPRPNKRHRAIDNQRHRFAACIYQEKR